MSEIFYFNVTAIALDQMFTAHVHRLYVPQCPVVCSTPSLNIYLRWMTMGLEENKLQIVSPSLALIVLSSRVESLETPHTRKWNFLSVDQNAAMATVCL